MKDSKPGIFSVWLGDPSFRFVFAPGSSMETFKWSQVIQNFRICAFMPSPTYSNTCTMRVNKFKREKKREGERERKCLESKLSKVLHQLMGFSMFSCTSFD